MNKLVRVVEFFLIYSLFDYVKLLVCGCWGQAAFTLCSIAVQCWSIRRINAISLAHAEMDRIEREYLLFMLRLPVRWEFTIYVAYE